MTNPARPGGPAADPRHLLVIGAGPGLGSAIAHRFAQGGYHLTLLARHTNGLAKLASDLADTDAAAGTVAADASDPAGLRAALTSLYASTGAPGVLVYNASMLTAGSPLSSDVARLHEAYDVDVVGAIVVTQVAASAMRAAGGGTIVFTGGGWADHPGPAWRATAYASPASPSPGRSGRAHRSARTRLQRSTGRSCNQRAPGKANSASTEHEPPALPHHLASTAEVHDNITLIPLDQPVRLAPAQLIREFTRTPGRLPATLPALPPQQAALKETLMEVIRYAAEDQRPAANGALAAAAFAMGRCDA